MYIGSQYESLIYKFRRCVSVNNPLSPYSSYISQRIFMKFGFFIIPNIVSDETKKKIPEKSGFRVETGRFYMTTILCPKRKVLRFHTTNVSFGQTFQHYYLSVISVYGVIHKPRGHLRREGDKPNDHFIT